MWGSPGTMLAARAMHEWTGEERWADAWRESAEALLARRDEDGLWTQRLYGKGPERRTGSAPVHGVVGIVHALLQARASGTSGWRARRRRSWRGRRFLEDGLATWPASAGRAARVPKAGSGCSGATAAPGIVATAAPYLDEELLLAGAELTWQAGAQREEKGAGLCHGTAGNGYALLKTFGRTGDERWLERARRFAVHALAQAQRFAGPLFALHRRRRRGALRGRRASTRTRLPGARLALGSRDGAELG